MSVDKDFFMYDDESLMDFRQLAKVSSVLGEKPVDSRQLMKVQLAKILLAKFG